MTSAQVAPSSAAEFERRLHAVDVHLGLEVVTQDVIQLQTGAGHRAPDVAHEWCVANDRVPVAIVQTGRLEEAQADAIIPRLGRHFDVLHDPAVERCCGESDLVHVVPFTITREASRPNGLTAVVLPDHRTTDLLGGGNQSERVCFGRASGYWLPSTEAAAALLFAA